MTLSIASSVDRKLKRCSKPQGSWWQILRMYKIGSSGQEPRFWEVMYSVSRNRFHPAHQSRYSISHVGVDFDLRAKELLPLPTTLDLIGIRHRCFLSSSPNGSFAMWKETCLWKASVEECSRFQEHALLTTKSISCNEYCVVTMSLESTFLKSTWHFVPIVSWTALQIHRSSIAFSMS